MKKTAFLCILAAIAGASAVWLATPPRDGEEWRRSEAVAVGSGYSIALRVKPADSLLAEYHEKIEVYGGSAREGGLLGSLDLPMNTGGRVRVLVFRSRKEESPIILLRDRYVNSLIDLRAMKRSDADNLKEEDFQFIGAFSGEAYPMKFVPAAVWEKMTKVERGETG